MIKKIVKKKKAGQGELDFITDAGKITHMIVTIPIEGIHQLLKREGLAIAREELIEEA